jgi:hypothetical protein
VAFVEQSGFPTTNAGAGLTTLAVSPVNVGDLMVFGIYTSSQPLLSAITVTGGGVTTWTPVTQVYASDGFGVYLFFGTVTATGSQTVTVNYTAIASDFPAYVADSYTYSGASAFTVVSGAVVSGTAVTTVTWPALTSPASGSGLYWGLADSYSMSSPSSGFTLYAGGDNSWAIYDASLANSTLYTPTSTQSTAYTYGTVAAIFSAVTTPASGTSQFFSVL